VFLMGAIILFMSFAWIAWYCSFRKRQLSVVPFMSRRTLVWQAASFIAFLVSLRLPRAEARTIERRLQETSSNPANPENIQEVTEILVTAKSAGVRASSATIGKIGNKFINASREHPEAWAAAVAFVDYKSFLNSFAYPLGGKRHAPDNSGYLLVNPFKSTLNVGLAGNLVPPENMPQLRRLDSLDANPRDGRGLIPEYIQVNGGTVPLDDFYMKQVIFDNVDIVYRGGQSRLEKVYFINCTFQFDPLPRAPVIEFAKSILDTSSVTFQAG
jgi:hypothetical protein